MWLPFQIRVLRAVAFIQVNTLFNRDYFYGELY